jgi:hypothetical protein
MILINLARIKPDSTALEFNVETDSNYTFKNLYMWTSIDTDIWVPDTQTVDLSSYLDKTTNVEIKSIPLADLLIEKDLIYYLQFIIEWDGTGTESTDPLYSNSAVVDLSSTYNKKMELIKVVNNEQSIDRDHLFEIYISEGCLKLALSLERYEDANYYCANIKKLLV